MALTNDARRRALRHGAALGLLGGVAALLPRATRAQAIGSFPEHPKWRLTFVNHSLAHPFFVATQYGIQDACALLGCEHQWTGSMSGNVGEMTVAMNAAVAGHADAIGVSLTDPIAFTTPIAQAHAAGIPVFGYNADAPESGRVAFIGQDSFAAGEMIGRRAAQLIPRGEVILFISLPGQSNLQLRVEGAQAAIKASGQPISVDVVATGPVLKDQLAAIRAATLDHPDAKGMFAVDSSSAQGLTQVMRESGLAAKGIKAGGFDMLPLTLAAIEAGHLEFTIDQQPYLQGFYTVMQMFITLVSGGLVGPADINTGPKMVTRDKVKAHLGTRTRFEGDSPVAQIVPKSANPSRA